MEVHEYLRTKMRRMPGGVLAWNRTLFSASSEWEAGDLIDAAVDIAWESFYPDRVHERPSMEVRRSGGFIVFRVSDIRIEDLLWKAA